jgi:hypothetical protein
MSRPESLPPAVIPNLFRAAKARDSEDLMTEKYWRHPWRKRVESPKQESLRICNNSVNMLN